MNHGPNHQRPQKPPTRSRPRSLDTNLGKSCEFAYEFAVNPFISIDRECQIHIHIYEYENAHHCNGVTPSLNPELGPKL